MVARRLLQGHDLERDDGEHAGGQVQDEAAERGDQEDDDQAAGGESKTEEVEDRIGGSGAFEVRESNFLPSVSQPV